MHPLSALRAPNAEVLAHGSRVSPAATGDGLYHAEETAGSMNDAARFCTVAVSGARQKDIHVSLTSFDANGNPITTINPL